MIQKIKSLYVGIKFKILASVFVILILFALNAIFSYSELVKSKAITEKVSKVLRPSMINLGEFDLLVNNARNYVNTWNSVDLESHPDKLKLIQLINNDYPKIKKELLVLSNNWQWVNMRDDLQACITEMDELIKLDKALMGQLKSFDAYLDIMVKMETEGMLEEINPRSVALSNKIIKLQNSLKRQTDNAEEGMISGFDILISQSIFFSLIVIVLGVGMGVVLASVIVNPVNKLRELISRLSKGELPDMQIKVHKDEIGDMVTSMEDYIIELRKTSAFASEVGKGNLEENYQALSENDVLGSALVEMRDNLKTAQIARERQEKEEQFKQWYVTGVAKFAEILRDSNKGLKDMLTVFLKELAEYVDVQQGTVYIKSTTKDDMTLLLMASYGCDAKLLQITKIEVGEGLAGQAFKDSMALILPQIPEKFVHNYSILSGLGKTAPTSLVILPVKNDKNTVGVIEFSSYKLIYEKKIEFLTDVINSLATIIVNVQLNEQTQVLLAETKEQTIRIQQSEEEMRQNMEEMRAVQEQMEMRTEELNKQINLYKDKFGPLS